MTTVSTRLGNVAPVATGLRVARATLLALTTLATLLSMLTYPFDAQEGEFFHALRNGEISSVAVGHPADFTADFGVSHGDFGVSHGDLGSSNGFSDTDNIAVSWVNRFGFRRWAALTDLRALADLRQTGEDGSPAADTGLDPAASITATARGLGLATLTVVEPGDLFPAWMRWLPRVAWLVMIAILVAGPRPRRMSKPGAFWAYSAPLNVGIFYALLRDTTWNQRMSRLPEPQARDRVVLERGVNTPIHRHGGWAMFFWSILIGLVISLVLLAVSAALPTRLDPVVWTAVDLAGNRPTIP